MVDVTEWLMLRDGWCYRMVDVTGW